MSVQTSDQDLKNAQSTLIPPTSLVLPPPAFVSAMPILATQSGSFDVSSLGILHFDPSLLADRLSYNYFSSFSNTFSWAGNDLAAESVDGILAALNASASSRGSSGTLDLSGGTNSQPTPQVAHADAIATLKINSVSNGDVIGIGMSNYTGMPPTGTNMTVDNTVNLADSTLIFNGTPGVLGIADSPTNLQINQKLAALITSAVSGLGAATCDGSGLITWTITGTESLITDPESQNITMTVQLEAGTPNFTSNQIQAGYAFQANLDLNNLVNVLGWTANVN